MTEKEFRRLSRRQLLDIIFELQKREKLAREQLAQAREALADREIRLSRAGSIAEAAMGLNDVFAHAQAAADQYVQEVDRAYRQIQEERDRIIAQANQEAEQIIAQARKQALEDGQT